MFVIMLQVEVLKSGCCLCVCVCEVSVLGFNAEFAAAHLILDVWSSRMVMMPKPLATSV